MTKPAAQGVMVRSAAVPTPRASAEAALINPLVERLESLSFTLEALNASSRTYAAEAVLETLGRMERRDLQALAAIEAFASAMKTVSQHLSGLRNAIQSTAQDTAHGLSLINDRLDRLESQSGTALPGHNQLALIADRLGHIEDLVGQGGIDTAPLQNLLEEMHRKVEHVDEKLDELPQQTAHLETIAERITTVERKLDEAKPVDVTPLRQALETIGQRVSRIETRMEVNHAATQKGMDTAVITDVLNAVAGRISAMESKVDSAGSVASLNGLLDMVNQRLERMEEGLNNLVFEEVVEEAVTAPAPVAPSVSPAAPMSEPVPDPAPVLSPVTPPVSAPHPDVAPPQRQQVDNLLEQVLKVLSR